MSERTRVTELLSREEIAHFTKPSDLAGAWAIVFSWAVIAATFAFLARFPHPASFLLAVIVLGGRQLALAILMHEAAHRSLFRTRWLNDVLTDWLCARPVWGHVARYRKHHIAHHAYTGTDRDPDSSLAVAFPISRASLTRKIARDLGFVSGIKRLIGLVLMDLEILEYNVSGDAVRRNDVPGTLGARLRAFARNATGVILTNGVLFGVLWSLGVAWVYLAWAAAWFTTYGLFLRIRSFAEHACTDRTDNPFRNTRTTTANLLARMTIAPLHVNYHLEHHLLVTVPWFRLPALHRLLRSRGALEHAVLAPDYVSVVRTVTSV